MNKINYVEYLDFGGLNKAIRIPTIMQISGINNTASNNEKNVCIINQKYEENVILTESTPALLKS